MEWLQAFDMSILDGIQSNLKCAFMDVFMTITTFLGDNGLIWILCALAMLFIGRFRRCGAGVAIALIISLLLCNLLLKNIVTRVRPCDVRDGFELLISHPSGFSFPSGHSSSSFAAATTIFSLNRRFGIAALSLAVLIAFSRMYLFVHYPTDVLCGTLLGIAIGITAAVIIRRFYPRVCDRFSRLRAKENAEK